MRLKRVDISNYRSIKEAAIDFETRCRILIGKNEVGKTNLLSACGLLDPAAQISAADLRETRDGEDPVTEGKVRFVFGFSAEEMKKLKAELLTRVAGADRDLCTEGQRSLSAEKFLSHFQEWLHVVGVPDGARRNTHWSVDEFQLVDGWLCPKEGVEPSIAVELPSGEQITLGQLMLVRESDVPAEHASYFRKATWNEVVAKYWALVNSVIGLKVPKCLYWTYSEANLLPHSIDIESFRANPATCEPLRAMFLLAGEKNPTDSIDRARSRPNGLKNLLTRVGRRATTHIHERWKELGAIEIVLAPNGAQIDAAVRDAFNEFAFNRRSEGFKRFVSFLILVSAMSVASDFTETVFIQDEPDLGLHPSGVKSLLKELLALSKNNYVLISSHSIFMVDKERVDRHLLVEKSKEATSVHAVNRSQVLDEEVLFNALGYSLFELVKKHNIVFEGWRDKKLFQTQLRKRGGAEKFLREKLKRDLGLTHAMGVKDIPKVVTYFDVIDRESFVVSDSDDVAIERQRQLGNERPGLLWRRYDELLGARQVLTAEDFIRPMFLRSSLVQVLSEQGLDAEADLALFEPAPAGGVVRSVDRHLEGRGIQSEERKKLLNLWKSAIFDELEVDDIAQEYAVACAEIAALLGYVPVPAEVGAEEAIDKK